MSYVAPPVDQALPLPYTVRNTFIDWAPADDEDAIEGIFSTWHHPARQPAEEPEEQPSPSRTEPPQGASAGRRCQQSPEPEDGEVSAEEGELEDGELPSEDEDADEGASASVAGKASPKGASLHSVGSAGHAAGTCRPCAWMHKSAEGCRNGADCEYCHLCPPGEVKKRKQEKMQRRYLESRRAREEAAGSQTGGSQSPASPSPDLGRPGRQPPQVMEPCYIELPGLVATNRPVKASLGSVGHSTGQCRPCAWVYKDANGCKNGSSCNYCHLCPPGELKRRKRLRWEAAQQSMASNQASPSGTSPEVVHAFSATGATHVPG